MKKNVFGHGVFTFNDVLQNLVSTQNISTNKSTFYSNYIPNEIKGCDLWQSVMSDNITRQGNKGFALGGYGYNLNGQQLATYLSSFTRFNDSSNTWATLVLYDLKSRTNANAFSISDYAYICNGYNGIESESQLPEYYSCVTCYNDINATLTLRNNNGLTSTEGTGVSLNDYGYVCGGKNASDVFCDLLGFNHTTDIWSVRNPLPYYVGKYGCASFILNDAWYLCNGATITNITSSVLQYNDIENIWLNKANTSSTRLNSTGFDLYHFGYICNGYNSDNLSTVEEYNDSVDYWINKNSNLIARTQVGNFNVNGNAYACNGYSTSAISSVSQYRNYNYFFLPSLKTSSKAPKRVFVTTTLNNESITLPLKITSNTSFYYFESNKDSLLKKDQTLNTVLSSNAGWREYSLYIGIPYPTYNGNRIWCIKTNSPRSLSEQNAFTLNGLGYFANGYSDIATSYLTHYNHVTNVCTDKTPNTHAKYYGGVFVANNVGYSLMGNNGTSDISNISSYNNETDTWLDKTNATANKQFATFQLNYNGFVCGGNDSSVTKYNYLLDTWTTNNAMPVTKKMVNGFNLHEIGYIAGGYNTDFSSEIIAYNDAYDWYTYTATFTRHSFTVFNNYLCYGTSDNTNTDNTIYEYNDGLKICEIKDAYGTGKCGASAFTINKTSYIANGRTSVPMSNNSSEICQYIELDKNLLLSLNLEVDE